jgi:hypothetical protein
MRRQKSTTILDTIPDASNQAKLWERAIADAEEMIRETETQARGRVKELKSSIRMLTALRAKGAAFPGAIKNVNEKGNVAA